MESNSAAAAWHLGATWDLAAAAWGLAAAIASCYLFLPEISA
jgi:hypothetical protein